MKKYLLMLCCAAVCAGFVGCSDDDEGADVSLLLGRWSCYQDEYWEDGEWDVYDDYGDGEGLFIMEFNADGTGGEFEGLYLSQLNDEYSWDRFTYKLKGSQLIVRLIDVGVEGEFRVEKITSSELVLVYQEEGEGIKYTTRYYFHRMK